MKRLIAFCTALLMVLALGGCQKQAPLERKDYADVETMAKVAPYRFWLPTVLPEGFELDSVWSMGDETFRFLYKNGDREIVWSASQYTGDPSGDRGHYEIFQTRTIYKYTLAMKSNDGEHFLSAFSQKQGGYNIGYAINGATEDELFILLGGLRAYRPRIVYADFAAMRAKMDFDVWIPAALPEGFAESGWYSLADEVFRVTYGGPHEAELSVSMADREPAGEVAGAAYRNHKVGDYALRLVDHEDGTLLATWTIRNDKDTVYYALDGVTEADLSAWFSDLKKS